LGHGGSIPAWSEAQYYYKGFLSQLTDLFVLPFSPVW